MNWLSINTSEINPEQSEDGGLLFQYSPYDVPDAARVRRDPATKRWTIEFTYFGIVEELRLVQQEPGIWVQMGHKSLRVYSIALDANAGSKVVNINKALGGLSTFGHSDNHFIIEKIIESNRSFFLPSFSL